jgi:hypothetical protein
MGMLNSGHESMKRRDAWTAGQVDELFEGLGSKTARVRYGAAKGLRTVSEQAPDLLYPRWDSLVRMLDDDNAFMRWGAQQILGNLAAADRENRFEPVFDRFFAPISGREMIGAANAIVAGAGIALAKPHLADRIVKELLKVERASYCTPECRNVAIGHAIKSFDRLLDYVRKKRSVRAFVIRQLDNPRPATHKKAERLVKRWGAK